MAGPILVWGVTGAVTTAIGTGYYGLYSIREYGDSLVIEARQEFEARFPNLATSQPINSDDNEWSAFRHIYGTARTTKILAEAGVPDAAASKLTEALWNLREVGLSINDSNRVDWANNSTGATEGLNATSSSQQDIGDLVESVLNNGEVFVIENGEPLSRHHYQIGALTGHSKCTLFILMNQKMRKMAQRLISTQRCVFLNLSRKSFFKK